MGKKSQHSVGVYCIGSSSGNNNKTNNKNDDFNTKNVHYPIQNLTLFIHTHSKNERFFQFENLFCFVFFVVGCSIFRLPIENIPPVENVTGCQKECKHKMKERKRERREKLEFTVDKTHFVRFSVPKISSRRSGIQIETETQIANLYVGMLFRFCVYSVC